MILRYFFKLLSKTFLCKKLALSSIKQVYQQKKMEQLQLLQVRSYFDNLMDPKLVLYPRKFPVDNEDYIQ